MRFFLIISGVLTFFIGMVQGAGAEDVAVQPVTASDAQRLCLDEDIDGHYYKMVDFNETPPRQETKWKKHFPYEYMTFFARHTYSALASNIEYKTPKDLEKFLKPGRDPGLQYTLDKGGVLNLIDHDRIRVSYRCVAVLKPEGVYIPGDIILNGYTRKAKSEIYRLYRRWY